MAKWLGLLAASIFELVMAYSVLWIIAKGCILGSLLPYILPNWSHLLSCLQLLFDDHSQIPIFSSALSPELHICKYNMHSLNKNLLNSSKIQ